MPLHSNKGDLTSVEKLDYFISWFSEFSEMQKGDFLEIICKKYNDKIENLTNGFDKLNLNNDLPSIFYCRMKLFDEWFPTWSEDEKDQLIKRMKNLDVDFVNKFITTLETGKLPTSNLNYCSYEISDEIYNELRRDYKQHNGLNLNSLEFISIENLKDMNNENLFNEFNTNDNFIEVITKSKNENINLDNEEEDNQSSIEGFVELNEKEVLEEIELRDNNNQIIQTEN